MKVPKGGAAAATSASLTNPAIVVVIVLLLGATIYLWRARYIRRRTALGIMALLAAGLIGLGVWMYLHPFDAS